MQITESIKMAVGSIRANKLRAGLTLLSIAVGVFAIVGVASSVDALGAGLQKQLSALGTTSFSIRKSASVNFGDGRRRNRNRPDITLRQGQEFKSRMLGVDNISLSYTASGLIVKYNAKRTDPNVTVLGADEGFATAYNYELATGRMIDAADVQSATDVALLGSELASRLFGDNSPLGEVIAVGNHRYTIVGTLAPKGAVGGISQDRTVMVPITSASKYFFDEWLSSVQITVRARSAALLDESVSQGVGIMRMIRRLDIGEANDFEVETNESIRETFSPVMNYTGAFGIACGAIALVAAGVGIMNIMLVSVKERTREIGIRKAVGATRSNILAQFIVEALTLCELGAAAGVLVGVLAGVLIGNQMGVSPSIPWGGIAAAISACTLIGLVFGTYPAWKASRLDPIDALRYE